MFGQKSTFGAPLFGSSSAFGGQTTSLFGAKPSTPFAGNATQSGGLFGATATTTAPSGGLFGNTAPTAAGTGLFGSTNAFGQTGTSLFGAAAQSKPLFGGTTTSAFGTQQQQPQQTNAFGQPASAATTAGNLFGQSSVQPSGSLFGGTQASVGLFGSSVTPAGTTIKFEPVIGSDTMLKNSIQTNISTKHQCITSMKQYEGKSLEELRVEDYLQNRKGPQAGGAIAFGSTTAVQPSTSNSLFGTQTAAAPSATMSLFGQQQNKPAFGGSLFGGTQPTMGLGQPAASNTTSNTGLFGQSKPLFGAAQTSTAGSSLFSLANTSKPGEGGLFGQQKPTGLFGTAPATSTSAFSQAPAFNFGQVQQPQQQQQQQQQGGGLFGSAFGTATSAPSTQTTSIFGNTAGGLFGSKPTATSTAGNLFPTFGSTGATQQGSLFGGIGQTQQKPLFGGGASTLFGQPAVSKPMGTIGTMGGGFLTTPASGAQTGLFGSFNKTMPTLGTSTLGTTGGLFGSSTSGFQTSSPFSSSATGLAIANEQAVHAAQEALIRSQLSVLANSPYGQSPLLKLIDTPTISPTDPAKQREALSLSMVVNGVSERPTRPLPPVRSYPRLLNSNALPLLPVAAKPSPAQPGLIGGDLERSKAALDNSQSGGFSLKRNIKKLIIKTGQETSQKDQSSVINGFADHLELTESTPAVNLNGTAELISPIPSANVAKRDVMLTTPPSVYKDAAALMNGHRTLTLVCSRQDYYCAPSVDELQKLVDADGSCVVDSFTVGRRGYGSVTWPGPIDVAGLDLDRLVHFDHREVTVYPEGVCKPPRGGGLNRFAVVTLKRMWPVDKTTGLAIKDSTRIEVLKYRQKLEKACQRMGAKFVDFDPATGQWTFEVDHFSKYGLANEDDLSDEEGATTGQRQEFQILDVSMQSPTDSVSPAADQQTRGGWPTAIGATGVRDAEPDSKRVKVTTSTLAATLNGVYNESEQMMDEHNLSALADSFPTPLLARKNTLRLVAPHQSLTRAFSRHGFKASWLTTDCIVRCTDQIGQIEICKFGSSKQSMEDVLQLHHQIIGHHLSLDQLLDAFLQVKLEDAVWSQSFRLCKILFGTPEGGEQQFCNSPVDEACRVEQLKQWLSAQCSSHQPGAQSFGNALLDHLLNGRIEEAAEQACSEQRYRLALVVCSAAVSADARAILSQAYAGWKQRNFNSSANTRLLRVYAALSGSLDANWWSMFLETDRFHWHRLLLFVLCFSTDGWRCVADALASMEKVSADYGDDVRCRLLRVFADRKYPVDAVLDVAGDSFFDFRFRWLLWLVLSKAGLGTQEDSVRIHLAYANQLAANDLWTHSLYVLMHIDHVASRQKALQSLLLRMVQSGNEVSVDLVNRLGVAETLRADVMALVHIRRADWPEAVSSQLKADLKGAARRMLIERIVPDVFLQGNLSSLKELLEMVDEERATNDQCKAVAGLLSVVNDLQLGKEICAARSVDDVCSLLRSMASFSLPSQRQFRRRATALLVYALRDQVSQAELMEQFGPVDKYLPDEVDLVRQLFADHYRSPYS